MNLHTRGNFTSYIIVLHFPHRKLVHVGSEAHDEAFSLVATGNIPPGSKAAAI